MARARSLKPGFFKNEDLAALGYPAMLLYQGLWVLADREGRLEDRPQRIKAEIFPYSKVNVDEQLTALDRSGFITRYEIEGKRYICIPTWKKHQNPHVKEAASTIPAPCSPGALPDEPGAKTPDSLDPEPCNLNPQPRRHSPRGVIDCDFVADADSDGLPEQFIGAFVAAGVKLSQADVTFAHRGTDRTPGFLSFSEEVQRTIVAHVTEKARRTSAQFMGLPINYLSRREWERVGTGRVLPPPAKGLDQWQEFSEAVEARFKEDGLI